MAASIPIYTVDAFTDVPFEGNPAAVCPLTCNSEIPNHILQKIAIEMNLSETAFPKLLSSEDSFEKSSTFGLRWFTPKKEIKLCGHATLATAAILFDKFGNSSSSITFQTLSGDLIVRKKGDLFRMDFPTGYTETRESGDYKELIMSLGDITGVEDVVYCSSLRYLLVRLKDGWTRKQFEGWQLKMGDLSKSTDELVALIVTIKGSPEQGFFDKMGNGYDFVSRCFGPWMNVPKDPVCGSAETVLAHYWSKVLNKTMFNVRQCSERGGDIQTLLRGDRVDILGKARIVIEGKFML
ncbi:phenazine biosynthesis-like domain-containing protein 1 [Patella vulgata]|uniref:phenazine biosynthesis-like domain-containing protein 1 n=1 Tax=Patella vulgata TaxID=6465 RepID=UPI00217FC1EA|nr:phenazine biosynthesis-like domain-containing protein 1 [Patella vulgata]